MQGNFRISNAFQLGLLGGLGVLTALLIGGAVTTLANVITYVAAAIFIALGLEPIVTKITSLGVRRRFAILIVMAALLTLIAILIASVFPTLASQTANFLKTAPTVLSGLTEIPLVVQLDNQFAGAISDALVNAGAYLGDSSNWPKMLGGVVQVGLSIFNGFFGALIVLVLSLYFMASMSSFKKWLYSLVADSRREKFADIAEQIANSVGRYVMGQVSIGFIQSALVFILLSVTGVPFALVISALAFLLGLIPLVGTITAAAIASLVALSVSPTTAIIVALFYIVYMQIEAYVISPRIMSRAVEVPGAVVVVAALAGGALLGVLGALVAIPIAASIILIIRQVLVPYQQQR
jgi:predicted PurR-regulated permease PerM